MELFPSLGYSLFAARSVLRVRFDRNLQRLIILRTRQNNAPSLKDEEILGVLIDTSVRHNDELTVFHEHYEKCRVAADVELPPFEEGVARGWFRIIWGRVLSSRQLRDFLRYKTPKYHELLLEILSWLWQSRFIIKDESNKAGVGDLLERIRSAHDDNWEIDARSPEWIAARLWDRAPDTDIKNWMAQWKLLGQPDIAIGRVWEEATAGMFRKACITAITGADLPTWNQLDPLRGALLAETGDIRTSSGADRTNPPEHLLGKYLWLERPMLGYHNDMDDADDLMALVSILARDVPLQTYGPAPSLDVVALVDLAAKHPHVLEVLPAGR